MADLEIDLLRHRATRAGQRLDLTSKEFLLLTLLARRSGDALTFPTAKGGERRFEFEVYPMQVSVVFTVGAPFGLMIALMTLVSKSQPITVRHPGRDRVRGSGPGRQHRGSP